MEPRKRNKLNLALWVSRAIWNTKSPIDKMIENVDFLTKHENGDIAEIWKEIMLLLGHLRWNMKIIEDSFHDFCDMI